LKYATGIAGSAGPGGVDRRARWHDRSGSLLVGYIQAALGSLLPKFKKLKFGASCRHWDADVSIDAAAAPACCGRCHGNGALQAPIGAEQARHLWMNWAECRLLSTTSRVLQVELPLAVPELEFELELST
jgi:hypothetical protein